MLNIPPALRITMIVGSVIYLVIIFVLLKRKKLNVQYSIIWLASAVIMIVFAVFPYIIAVLRDIFSIEVPVNLVFTLLFIFVLLLLLSLSIIVTGFSARINRLIQTQALLEERVRRLEAEKKAAQPGETAAPPLKADTPAEAAQTTADAAADPGLPACDAASPPIELP